MSKKILVLFCILFGGSVLVACGNESASVTEDEQAAVQDESPTEVPTPTEVVEETTTVEKTVYVAPYTELCVEDDSRECLLTRESLADEWQSFDQTIEGFQYIAGFNYKLLIYEEENVADSTTRYVLGEILSQEGSFEAPVEEEETAQISSQVWLLDFLITNSSALQREITLQFGEGQVSGSGGCNDYVASFITEGEDDLRVESIGASRKLCDELISQQERDYFDALAMVATFEQTDASTLSFLDGTGTTILTFVTGR